MPREAEQKWKTVPDVCTRFRISRSTAWDWVAKGKLPQPHHIGQRAVWPAAEIDAAEARIVQPPRAA